MMMRLARFREAFVERDLAGALHHVVLVFRVRTDAMYVPTRPRGGVQSNRLI